MTRIEQPHHSIRWRRGEPSIEWGNAQASRAPRSGAAQRGCVPAPPSAYCTVSQVTHQGRHPQCTPPPHSRLLALAGLIPYDVPRSSVCAHCRVAPARLNVLLIRITKRLVRWVAAVSPPIGPIRVSFNRPRLPPSSVLSVLATETKVQTETRGTVNGNGTEPATTSQLGSATRRGGGAGRGRPHLALPFAGTCARPSRAPPGPQVCGRRHPAPATSLSLYCLLTGPDSRHVIRLHRDARFRRGVPRRAGADRSVGPLGGGWERGRRTDVHSDESRHARGR